MSPLDCPKACHETRSQLSGIACDRELTKEEKILHNTATRFMNRLLLECEKQLEKSTQDTPNENPPRLSENGETEVSPG